MAFMHASLYIAELLLGGLALYFFMRHKLQENTNSKGLSAICAIAAITIACGCLYFGRTPNQQPGDSPFAQQQLTRHSRHLELAGAYAQKQCPDSAVLLLVSPHLAENPHFADICDALQRAMPGSTIEVEPLPFELAEHHAYLDQHELPESLSYNDTLGYLIATHSPVDVVMDTTHFLSQCNPQLAGLSGVAGKDRPYLFSTAYQLPEITVPAVAQGKLDAVLLVPEMAVASYDATPSEITIPTQMLDVARLASLQQEHPGTCQYLW